MSKPVGSFRLAAFPCTLAQANELVARWHRHHKPAQGHRFSIGVEDSAGEAHGAAIVGRPVARMTDQYRVAEIARCVTDGSPNAPSFLYGKCAAAAEAMGFDKIQTFILATEPGTSLRAAGYEREAESSGGDWTRESKPNRRQDQPQGPKVRWARVFKRPVPGKASSVAAKENRP